MPDQSAKTPPPPLNASPKYRFMQMAVFLKEHRALIDRPEFQRGLDYALMEYQNQLCNAVDANSAAANHFKMTGALQFVHQLKYLAESRPITKVENFGNLTHS